MTLTASRPRILIVDDDAAERNALRLALDQHHEVVEASDGEAALALLKAHRADIIVLDLQLPAAGGFQVLDVTLCTARSAIGEMNL